MSTPQHAVDLQRLDEATEWLQTLHDAPMDESTLSAWLRWSADAENLREFERLQRVWQGVGRLEQQGLLPARRFASIIPRTRWAASVLLTLGLGAWLAWSFIGTPGRQYRTDVAAITYIPLADGSRLQLGPLSKVSTRFSEQARLVTIVDGEAYFEVAKDPRRPFVVDTGAVRITAVGTAFNVRKYAERVRVTVTEGRVRISTAQMPPGEGAAAEVIEARAGQQVEYRSAARHLSIAGANVQAATGWRTGVLKFVDEPLVNVVADLNRYSHRQIVIGDAALGTLPYTGTVFAGRIDQWLVALEDAFPLYVEESEPERVRLKMK